MVLTLGINFLPFASVENLLKCPKIPDGKFYGDLFGCLLFQRLNVRYFPEKNVKLVWKISHLLSGLFF